MRRGRYRGQPKAHLQHVLTAIAVNIERLSGLPPTREAPPSPTAFRASWTSTGSAGRIPDGPSAIDLDDYKIPFCEEMGGTARGVRPDPRLTLRLSSL